MAGVLLWRHCIQLTCRLPWCLSVAASQPPRAGLTTYNSGQMEPKALVINQPFTETPTSAERREPHPVCLNMLLICYSSAFMSGNSEQIQLGAANPDFTAFQLTLRDSVELLKVAGKSSYLNLR